MADGFAKADVFGQGDVGSEQDVEGEEGVIEGVGGVASEVEQFDLQAFGREQPFYGGTEFEDMADDASFEQGGAGGEGRFVVPVG